MEENFSPQQSLQLIQSMIEKTKTNIGGSRFYFLFWGWYVFLAFILEFLLKVVIKTEYHSLVWLGVFPAVIITIIHSRKNSKSSVRTYVGDSMGYLWTGIGISFFVMSFIISNMGEDGWYHGYPFFILFYGLGTFVSGKILQFKPLIYGGIFNWVLACVCVLVPYDYQLLIAATAILCSYIIPGHLIANNKN